MRLFVKLTTTDWHQLKNETNMSFPDASETTSTIRCDTSCFSDQVKPVSRIMVDKENKILTMKTEYTDDKNNDDKADTTVREKQSNYAS